MHKAIITDLNKCVGCMACSVGCKAVNGVDIGQQWIKIKRVGPYPIEGGSGQFPDVEMYFLPMQCQQCENAPCIEVCPTGASFREDETGYVMVDTDACIGCGLCVTACPFGARQIDEDAGIVRKCTLCHELTADGSDVPACVHNCNCGARLFGDFDDPESDVCREMARYSEDCIHELADETGAHPVTRYILSPKYASWTGEC